MRIGSELVSGLIVGFGIGWLLDCAFETKPLFIIIFFLAGGVAGILNVMRAANEHFKNVDTKCDENDTAEENQPGRKDED